MIENPERHVEAFAKAGADSISVHQEACRDLRAVLQQIKKLGKKASVAINPDTPVSTIEPVLDEVEMVLVMTVNPGWAGQGFIEGCLPKVREVARLKKSRRLLFEIEVDGGIKADNIATCSEAGATVFVAGSAIFKSPDYRKAIQEMKKIIAS